MKFNRRGNKLMSDNAVDPATWLDRHGDGLYRYALIRVRDAAIADDLVQETLLAAIEAVDRFDQQSSERTWLIGILKHKIIDHLRKSIREFGASVSGASSLALEDESFNERGHWQVEISDWSGPEKSLEQEDFWRVLNECVNRLPKRLATLFVLRELDGMTSEELCRTLHISSMNNLWVMLSRLRMRMRHCLDTLWFHKQWSTGAS
jgi:RNA polymerase sigma-70 factor (ECF subfamily)